MAENTSEFEEKGEGLEEFIDEYLGADGANVTLGVHSEDADKTEEGNLNLAALMSVHEFGAEIEHPGGTPYVVTDDGVRFVEKGHPNAVGTTDPHTIKIPARPALRKGIELNRDEISDFAGRMLGDVLEGKMTLKRGMNLLGQKAKKEITGVFGDSTILEPNAQSTERKKGSASPLIDDEQLRGAIDYQVHGL